jgi:REP element-mobilizing transposase RayT
VIDAPNHSFRLDIVDRRKHPAHHPMRDHHNQPIIVHLIVCSRNRKRIFASVASAKAITEAWPLAQSWLVGRYMIMPDHIHLFCAPATFPTEPLRQWVKYWKSQASNHWPEPNQQPIWQSDFWDTQLRRQESYHVKWQYVVNNPVRAGLVEHADEWPFQGELNVLRW